MFVYQIRRDVQVYMDNMLVKSRRKDDHLDHLKENFNTFCFYNMKLNNWCLVVESTRMLIAGGGSYPWGVPCSSS